MFQEDGAHLDGTIVSEQEACAKTDAEMGLEAIYPKPHLSKAGEGHPVYPYLLRGLIITQPDQVWAARISRTSASSRMALPGGDHGLVQSVCPLLGDLDHDGRRVSAWRPWRKLLCQCSRNLQYRPGCPVTSGAFTDMLKGKEITSAWMVEAGQWITSLPKGYGFSQV